MRDLPAVARVQRALRGSPGRGVPGGIRRHGADPPRLCAAAQEQPPAARPQRHQILGADLRSPVEMVVCWTPGARGRGGTGSGICLARSREIPVHDLADIAARRQMGELLGLDVEPRLDAGVDPGQLPLPL